MRVRPAQARVPRASNNGRRFIGCRKPAWERVALKPSYDVVIVGGGGHGPGLATAYYLATAQVGRIAVLGAGCQLAAAWA